MRARTTALEASLAAATALFVSMPGTAGAQGAALDPQAMRPRHRTRRCTTLRPVLQAGPIALDARRPHEVRATFWRPNPRPDCGAEVEIQVLDLETGQPIAEKVDWVPAGKAVRLDGQVLTTSLLGARVHVRPAVVDGTPACQETFPFRLTLQTVGADGRTAGFYEGWPCKWFRKSIAE